MAKGAAWMVAYRLVDRSLGMINTLVLARLLVPEDFGLVAMATSVSAILELFNAFGFDAALIQRANASRVHFDTVWTFNVGAGLLMGTCLLLLAWPLSLFYHDPRLLPLVCVVAASPAISGFENIGTVNFRKEMNFDREFRFFAAKRFIGFCVSIVLAFTLRSYWSLALGMIFGRLAGVLLSYRAHPFRPRLSLGGMPDLMHFSKWVFVQNFVSLVRERSADFIVGRIAGPHAVGVLSVSNEIASMPAAELVAPVNRAAFPAYSKLAADASALARQYLEVTSLIALVVIPAVFGIAALGTVMAALLLGPKWHEAATLISIVAFAGMANALINSSHPAMLATGKPVVFAKIYAFQACLLIPCLIVLTHLFGVRGAALAYVIATGVTLPAGLWLILRTLSIPVSAFLHVVWRPAAGAVVMYGVMRLAMPPVDAATIGTAGALELVVTFVPFGAAVYLATVLGLWLAAGRPEGAELTVAREAQHRWRRWRTTGRA
jgi:O-antigen/teichoic acid export membrane protein